MLNQSTLPLIIIVCITVMASNDSRKKKSNFTLFLKKILLFCWPCSELCKSGCNKVHFYSGPTSLASFSSSPSSNVRAASCLDLCSIKLTYLMGLDRASMTSVPMRNTDSRHKHGKFHPDRQFIIICIYTGITICFPLLSLRNVICLSADVIGDSWERLSAPQNKSVKCCWKG